MPGMITLVSVHLMEQKLKEHIISQLQKVGLLPFLLARDFFFFFLQHLATTVGTIKILELLWVLCSQNIDFHQTLRICLCQDELKLI